MDHWTAAAYVLMVVLVVAKGLLAGRMKIIVRDVDVFSSRSTTSS